MSVRSHLARRAAVAFAAAAFLLSTSVTVAAAGDAAVRPSTLAGSPELGGVAAETTVTPVAAAPLRRTPLSTATAPMADPGAAPITPSRGTVRSASGSELSQARAILRTYIGKHPILKGTTIQFGSTPNNAQAVAYYTVGRIVVNPNHTASLERIIAHEIWHVIDWRDNHRIDWGENVPPRG